MLPAWVCHAPTALPFPSSVKFLRRKGRKPKAGRETLIGARFPFYYGHRPNLIEEHAADKV